MIVELPGAAVLGLQVLANSGLAIINDEPGADDTGVPIGSDVALEIASGSGSPPDASNTTIEIDGVPAFTSGTFQTGFQGPNSATSTPDAQTLRIVIDPQQDFITLTVVSVRVVSQDLAAGEFLDITYTFTIEDLIDPDLVFAEALDFFRVRARFNEPVSAAAAVGGAGRLAAWALQPIDLPAISPAVVEVEQEAADTFVLTFPEELSFGRRYLMQAFDVDDLAGNRMVEGEAEFVAALCPNSPGDRVFELITFLPLAVQEADETGDQRALIAMMQEIFDLLLCDIDQFQARVVDPETAEERFVDVALCDMGNPFDFEDLDLAGKRRLLLSLIGMYKLKGTAPGIIAAVRFFLGIDVEVDAFGEDGWRLGEDELGETTVLNTGVQRLLYSFQIISPIILTDDERDRILKIGIYMKVAHEHLVRIVEPFTEFVDHWELGLSMLGEDTLLH